MTPNNRPNARLFRVSIPLIFGVGIFLFILYFLGRNPQQPRETFIRFAHGILITTGLWLGCIQIVIWLWKKFPWQEKPLQHLVYEIILILFYTLSFSGLLFLAEKKILNKTVEINLVYDIFLTVLITYFITAIHEALFFYRQWKLHFSKSLILERDKIEANYEALKNQVNPHFLFNSLNSLTAMVDDKPEAVTYITNLSEFLRYLLKSNEKELVSIEEELDVVDNYLSLQKSRFREALHTEIETDPATLELLLPPLVLQMLIENCIKHNVVSLESPLTIKIYTEGNRLIIENRLNKKKGVISTGKGLVNIKERYAIFTTQEVQIREDEQIFSVSIPLLKFER